MQEIHVQICKKKGFISNKKYIYSKKKFLDISCIVLELKTAIIVQAKQILQLEEKVINLQSKIHPRIQIIEEVTSLCVVSMEIKRIKWILFLDFKNTKKNKFLSQLNKIICKKHPLNRAIN